jgi:hypothetical protein
MRTMIVTGVLVLTASAPAAAVDFLGVKLCAGSVDTSVVLPVASPLTLESAEVGRHGGLLMLLKTSEGNILDHIDALMEPYVGGKGSGDEKKLQWSGNSITAYAQVIKKGYAALAVSTDDDCQPTPPAAAPEPISQPAPAESSPDPHGAATAAAVVAPASVAPASEAPALAPPAEYELIGTLKHYPAADRWVDVMGVVANRGGTSLAVTSFDLGLYGEDGALICVDTISINQLREGQERAFRSSILCPDYDADAVAGWKLQFAGGH